MTKCVKCGKRKAKRFCPALKKSICSLCCGTHRQKEIHCPHTCSFLVKHQPYQDKRTLEKKHPARTSSPSPSEDILNDERMAWLAFNIEVPIGQMAAKDDTLTDRDALIALSYARDRIEQDSRILIFSEKSIIPKNELGDEIFQVLAKCRFEKKIIVPGELQTYKQEEKIKCLDRVILAVKQIAGDNTGGRGYLPQLIERFSKFSELSRQQNILIPQ